MMILIKKIEGTVITNTIGDIIILKPITGVVQQEDYINLNGIIGYLQNLTRAEETSTLLKPIRFGVVNNHHIEVIKLNITY